MQDAFSVHFRDWQDLSKRLGAQLASTPDPDAMREALRPIVEAQATLQRAMEPALAQQERWRELVGSIQTRRFDIAAFSLIVSEAAEVQRSIERQVTLAFDEVQRTFRSLPPRTQEALLLLGAHGWYLDLEMPLPGVWKLSEILKHGDVAEADDALCGYYEGRLPEIEESISRGFPHRAHLIKAAFTAHGRREYALSIPVLLAQADGICKEVASQYYFMKQNKKPRTAIYVEEITADSFRAALLSPLAQTLPIGASERSVASDVLNRHAVLHGDSLDYGNRSNSLKAISLINYVAQVLGV
jgi:hypothetical protein